ncbi:MAG: DUF3035 domain-containing protein [bacterium]|nr:DUF3035 domain-containing protein [bacterium]
MKKSFGHYLGFSLILTTVILSGCAQVKKTFGLERQAPNEFQVMKNPPLTLPPEFHLRPPQPGKKVAPHNATTSSADLLNRSQQASIENSTPLSAGEKALLARSGTSDPAIRQKLAERTAQQEPADEYLFPSLVDSETTGDALDPVSESNRLKLAEK